LVPTIYVQDSLLFWMLLRSLEAIIRSHAVRVLLERGEMKPSLLIEKVSTSLSNLDPVLANVPDYLILRWILGSPHIFIDDETGLISFRSPLEIREMALSLVKREKIATTQEIAEKLGLEVKEARRLMKGLESEGLVISVSVHEPSKPPRRVLLFCSPSERGQAVHNYVKKVISSRLPLREEVKVGRWLVDLAGKGIWIEVVTSKLKREKWIELREKLGSLEGRKFIVVYNPLKEDMRWILKKAKKYFEGTEVRVLSFFDLPF